MASCLAKHRDKFIILYLQRWEWIKHESRIPEERQYHKQSAGATEKDRQVLTEVEKKKLPNLKILNFIWNVVILYICVQELIK
jgi:hypothetical protein